MDQSMDTCTCHKQRQETKRQSFLKRIRKTSRPIPTILTSIGIAFFPKCPLCWAVYMSAFSSFGLSRLPYMPWLLPLLCLVLGINLFFISKKIPQKGYFPFVVSFVGALILIAGRLFFSYQVYLLELAMILIIAGSLLNSFIGKYLPLPFIEK